MSQSTKLGRPAQANYKAKQPKVGIVLDSGLSDITIFSINLCYLLARFPSGKTYIVPYEYISFHTQVKVGLSDFYT